MRTKIRINADGSKTIHTYDEQDHHVQTTDYDANGQMTWDIIYDFDPKGNVSGWRLYGADGLLFKQFERHYNEQGLIEDCQYDAEGRLELRTVETYDENNKLVKLLFNPQGQQIDLYGSPILG